MRGRELQAFDAGIVRPLEGISAVPEGPDGEMRGGRGSPIPIWDINLLSANTISSVLHMTGYLLKYEALTC